MNFKIKFIIFLLLINCTIVKGQLEQSIWHFGLTTKGLYFAPSGAVTVTNNSYTPFGGEGCSVATDPVTGKLLFYTDGAQVIDAAHQIMMNGSGLNSAASSAGTGRIVVDPLSCNRFYIFHNTTAWEISPTGNLYYSIVDTSLKGNGTLANPLGEVVAGTKNILVATGVAEGFEVVPSTVDHWYWILVPLNSSAIRVYKLSSSGLSLQNTYNLTSTFSDIRAIRYSATNNKLAIASMFDTEKTMICDFNPATGVVSNQTIISGIPLGTNGKYYGIYDLEWSSDGTKLYISKYRITGGGGKLYQYDLTTSSMQLVYNVSDVSVSYGSRGLQMGPDGKIYHLYANSDGTVRRLGAVQYPNNPAATCGYNPTMIDMGSDLLNTNKFPTFIHYSNRAPFKILDTMIAVNTNCTGYNDTTFFNLNNPILDSDKDNVSYTVSSVKSTATAVMINNNTIRYINSRALPITDTITIKYCDDFCYSKCDTFKVAINISASSVPPAISLGNDTTVCGSYVLNPNSNFTSIVWNDNSTNQMLSVTSSGTYYATVTNACGSASDTVNVTINPEPVVFVPVVSSCAGGPVTLTASGATTYAWSPATGLSATTGTTVIANPVATITYTVIGTSNGCSGSTTVVVAVGASVVIFAPGDTICEGTSTTLNASGAAIYTWSPATGLSSTTGASLLANPIVSTTYTVSGTSAFGCSGSTTVVVTVKPTPIITCKSVSICPGEDTILTASGAISYLWSPAGSLSSSTGSIVTTRPTAITSYTITGTGINGCASSNVAVVTVRSKLFPAFTTSPNPADIFNPTIYFNDKSYGGIINSWNWSFGDKNHNTSTLQNPTFTYSDIDAMYSVQLIVTDQFGCIDTTITDVYIHDIFTFYIPNTFTPNGDRTNDLFMPKGTGIDEKDYHFWIYDRWGELIWQTEIWGEAWNGKANKGSEIAQMDTYVWKVHVREKDNHMAHNYIGHVNIIK